MQMEEDETGASKAMPTEVRPSKNTEHNPFDFGTWILEAATF